MNWPKQLQNASRDSQELLEELAIDDMTVAISEKAEAQFPSLIPQGFLNQIKTGDMTDPLLRQILASKEEEIDVDGFSSDPVGDMQSEKTPGLLHKYDGRVLLIVTGACAIHCRYCFRRHFPYQQSSMNHKHWQQALDYVKHNTDIEEVILSGGDPLTLSDNKLNEIHNDIANINHVTRLRIHSRIPTVLPERILESKLEWLNNTNLNPIMVLHINHAQEIGAEAKEAIAKIKEKNITLLNQSVLLKGVNDKAETLINLSKVLFEYGILPYYLHMLDPVQGASHFHVNEENAKGLLQTLRKKLPGYLIPKLVREIEGKGSKLPL